MSKVKARTDSTPASPDEQSSRAADLPLDLETKLAQANDMASTEANRDEDDDSFGPLMERLESAIHRLKLAAEDLSDLAETRPAQEHGSAAFVVTEVMKDLNQLYRDLDAWGASHEHTPMDMQPLMEHLRQIDADDETVNRMLHGCTVLPL